MWPRFLPSLYSNFLLALALCFGITQGQAQERGLIGTLEELMGVARDSYNRSLNKVVPLPAGKSLKDFPSAQLSPLFMANIILQAPPTMLKLMAINECAFLPYLEQGVLRGPEGDISRVLMSIQEPNVEPFLTLIPISDYLTYEYNRKCPNGKKISPTFALENMPNTIKTLEFKVPNQQSECLPQVQRFINADRFPFVCALMNRIALIPQWENELFQRKDSDPELQKRIEQKLLPAQGHKKIFNTFQLNFYSQLCAGFDHPQDFCQNYLATGTWNKALNGEKPITFLTHRCDAKVTEKDKLQKCATKLENDDNFCHYNQALDFPALVPKPSCKEINTALEYSHLFSDYKNCPARIDQTIISTFHEIYRNQNPVALSLNKDTCSSEPVHDFIAQVQEQDNEQAWSVGFCFSDPVLKTDRCLPTMIGHHPTSPYDEGEVFKKALSRFTSIDSTEKCQMISALDYNPQLLAHNQGCLMIYDPGDCTKTHCPTKFLYQKKEIKNIELKGSSSIEMIHGNSKRAPYSLIKLLKDQLKIQSKPIMHLTEFQNFLQDSPQGFGLGVGCLEDIYPWKFRRTTLGECRPITFLADGIQWNEGKARLIIRSGIDDIHSPRLVPWPQVFQSLIQYQAHHPLKAWTFYGIK